MTSILIYGFKPDKKFRSNITQKIVSKIPAGKNLDRIIFPVKFDEQLFLKKVQFQKPNVIIGLGQHPRAKKIRIERKAINLKGSKDKGYRPIDENGSSFRFVNLKLKKDNQSRISYDAGKFVCNFSMYILSKWSGKNDVKFAFIHVPKDFDVDLAVRFVKSKIEILKN